MATMKIERTPEYVKNEIFELQDKGFSSKSINLILLIEEKIDRSIYACISPKTTEEQLRMIKDKVYAAKRTDVYKNLQPLFGAVKRNIDISNVDLDVPADVLDLEIQAALSNKEVTFDYKKILNDIPDEFKKSVLKLAANGINLDYFRYEDYSKEGLEYLVSLSFGLTKIGKQNFETFFKDTFISPKQFGVLFYNCNLNKNVMDLNLCKQELSLEQLQALTSYKCGRKKIDYSDIYPLLNKNIPAENMNIFVKCIASKIDMSKYYNSDLDADRLKLIAKLLLEKLDPSILEDKKIDKKRAELIFKIIMKDKNKYDLSIFSNTTISDEIANSIYTLQKNGYTVINPSHSKEEER